MWAGLWNFQGQAQAGWELSILSWMVLFRPLRLLQRLDEPLSILLHKHTSCTKTDRGTSSLCSSLRGLNSSQPARACPWKFHNAAHTKAYLLKLIWISNDRKLVSYRISKDISNIICIFVVSKFLCTAIVTKWITKCTELGKYSYCVKRIWPDENYIRHTRQNLQITKHLCNWHLEIEKTEYVRRSQNIWSKE